MKQKIYLWPFLFFSLFGALAGMVQKKEKSLYELISPPGGIFLSDSLYWDETEIANVHYLEYLMWIKNDSTDKFYRSQLPDSTTWTIGLQPKDIYTQYYFRYPGFRFYPVMGVSYDQAVQYCKWRSRVVNQKYRAGTEKVHPKLKDYEITVEYRLPTGEEWEKAATGGLNEKVHPYGIIRPSSHRRRALKITKTPVPACLEKDNVAYDPKDIIFKMEFTVREHYYFQPGQPGLVCPGYGDYFGPQYIYAHPPNNYGLYNMIGNLAEMTTTKGIAKGGSFQNSLSEIGIQKDFPYEKPKEWLGFRCVAVVHLKKK